MSTYYRRRPPRGSESAKAAGIALGVGAAVAAVAYYVARLFIFRDTLPDPRTEVPSDGGEGSGPVGRPPPTGAEEGAGA